MRRTPVSDTSFLSTPSARRATPAQASHTASRLYFYPRPPRGGRPGAAEAVCDEYHFYPRPPRGGRQQERGGGKGNLSISIHALREEGNAQAASNGLARYHFYPRPPRGGRPCAWFAGFPAKSFLSTPSARRATAMMGTTYSDIIFLSTPSARRATLLDRSRPGGHPISIHALREEGND